MAAIFASFHPKR